MSSATSIDTPKVRLKPGAPHAGPESAPPAQSLTAGQFFLLVALGCATAATVMVRGQGVTTIILLTLLIGSTALVGLAALRTLNPLVSTDDDRTAVVGGRTRAALEREKVLVLRSIKELEFDRAMGKVSDSDFDEMSGRLRARAARLIRALDAGEGYREQIEKDLAKRLGEDSGAARTSPNEDGGRTEPSRGATATSERQGAERRCACGTMNDRDARFCKSCGRQL